MEKHEVVVTDVKIPFWSLVVLMVKLAVAAIPATFILAIAWGLVMGLLNSLLGGGMGGGFGHRW